ncbi:hypothetical protein ABMA27_010692 [Loxostege sticticalis]|uniref:carbonyl reductase (NADPH) n=1 Tax=Loxostege sticticalis TaxID=481309 RepID=A0ABR3H418_LOXSC
MSKKVAVVTGSNKGLGFAIVKALCSKFDGTVYLTSRDEQRGQAACEALRNQGLAPAFYQLDVTNEESITKFRDYIQQTHQKIDIIVNNAGILFLKDAKEPKAFQAEQTILVNFFALVNFTEAMLPLVRNEGRILNISSSSGHLSRIPSEELRKRISSEDLTLDQLKDLMSCYVETVKLGKEIEEGWGDSPYVVSKVGVNAYTFMLHKRLKSAEKGITVNCMHPGYVISDMTRGAGSVTPEQGAELALKLLVESCESGLYVWHEGTVVPWDGPDPRGYIDGKV